jgi:hypothetical protein
MDLSTASQMLYWKLIVERAIGGAPDRVRWRDGVMARILDKISQRQTDGRPDVGRPGREDAGTVCLVVRPRPEQSLTHTQVSVEVDGVSRPGRWGMQELQLEPGDHRVAVTFRYCRGWRGRAERRITLDPGAVLQLEYVTPSFMFFTRGRLNLIPGRACRGT